MSKRKTINVRPFNIVVINSYRGGFTLEVTDEKHLIKLNFENWWVGAIARKLWKVIDFQQGQIDEDRETLRSGK